jgi:L-seryl-tRNA(Ser) seleniumtransferase
MARLCGTEDAHVVNNGAAALLLALTALAAGREVLVSRGELVEIGGGFRIPEVIAASGCHLIEVGTTNKTRLADYERNISSDSALILKVHQSNYHMQGFVAAASIQELAGLGLPVLVDLGSGLIDDRVPWLKGPPPAWLKGEPAVRQTLSQGAAAVTFSGDKLLGGPQAGLIAGQREIVRRCAQHPMSRALRAGGLVLSNLQRTILAYMNKDLDELPLWKMASYSPADLEARARRIGIGAVARCTAKMGAGSLPGRGLESVGVAVKGDHRGRLLAFEPPIVSRVLKGHTLIDLRTVDPADDEVVAAALSSIVQESGSQSLDRIAALDLTEAPID